MEFNSFYEILRSGWIAIGIITFLGILAWAFWPTSRAEFEKLARIPLDER